MIHHQHDDHPLNRSEIDGQSLTRAWLLRRQSMGDGVGRAVV